MPFQREFAARFITTTEAREKFSLILNYSTTKHNYFLHRQQQKKVIVTYEDENA